MNRHAATFCGCSWLRRLVVLVSLGVMAGHAVPGAYAEFYRYVDESGRECYTDNPGHLPPGQLGASNAGDGRLHDTAADTGAQQHVGRPAQRIVVHYNSSDGAILVNGILNRNFPVVFLLDTGATRTMITEDDARILGLPIESSRRVQGLIADGSVVEMPVVRLASVDIGGARAENIEAVVGRMRLLGMDFLENFEMSMNAGLGQLVLVEKRSAPGNPSLQREPESELIRQDRAQAKRDIDSQIAQLKLAIKTCSGTIAQYRDDIEDAEVKRAAAESGLAGAREKTRFQGSGVSRGGVQQSIILRYEKNLEDIDALIRNRNDNIQLQEEQIAGMRSRIDYLRTLRTHID